jgi:hypothetical protein
MTGMLLAALDQMIVATALPTILGDPGGASHPSCVVTAYLSASTASTPLWRSSATCTDGSASLGRDRYLPITIGAGRDQPVDRPGDHPDTLAHCGSRRSSSWPAASGSIEVVDRLEVPPEAPRRC